MMFFFIPSIWLVGGLITFFSFLRYYKRDAPEEYKKTMASKPAVIGMCCFLIFLWWILIVGSVGCHIAAAMMEKLEHYPRWRMFDRQFKIRKPLPKAKYDSLSKEEMKEVVYELLHNTEYRIKHAT